MILLDTNIISELMRAAPSAAAQRWFGAIPRERIWTSAITVMELRYGLDLLPEGRRKTDLSDALERMLISAFRDRIAVFDDRAAEATARLMADSRRSGRPLAVEDGMIAGVALAREAVLATRNLKDFEGLGLTLVNPFQTA
jgi:hypothetical protein